MLKRLFVTAAAAAAMSVPLAGLAYADQPDDPGAGNQGVPDRAAAAVEAFGGSVDGFQSGNSTVVAPGTAYSTGAKVPGLNTPDGYGVALNTYWENQGIDPTTVPGYPFGRTIPGSVTKQFTHGAAQK
jgi:opacity protein-like surface antigen